MVATNSTAKAKRPAGRSGVRTCEPAPAYGVPDGVLSFRHGLRARERVVVSVDSRVARWIGASARFAEA